MPVAYPYRSPAPERVAVGPWVTAGAGTTAPLPKAVSDWDYSTVLALARDLDIDRAGILADCRLPDNAQIGVAVVWWPSTSLLRTPQAVTLLPATQPADASQRVTLGLTIPGHLAGGVTRIQTAVMLVAGGADEAWAPNAPGSELWSDEVEVRLEGAGPMFPMEVVDLGALGFDPGAPWALITPDSLSAAAMGGVRLILNERYPDVINTLLGEPTPARSSMESALWADVGATILDIALSRMEDLEETSYPEGAFGWVLENQARAAFGEGGLQRAAELRLTDPAAYRAQVNSHFGLMVRCAP